jgi:hypothetical protein
VVISPDNAPTSRLLLEQEASYDPKVSRTTSTARLTTCPLKRLSRLRTWYWVCFLQAHTLQQFYSIRGASHSFISSSLVVRHQLPITIMKQTMLVSSPRGEMRTKHICPAITITIREVDFLTNLIVLDSKGIDIILGMDWLRKHDGVILCAKRAIRLTKKDGTIVEFRTAIPAEQVSLLNKVQGTSLDEIGIVREYSDVFPEELPGMPPNRDIEYMIELLPGTPLSLKGHIGCL